MKKEQGFSQNNTVDIDRIGLELVTGEVVDLKNLLIEMNIYVSLFAFLQGNITFHDTLNITNNGPVLGGERLFVRWKSPLYSEYTEVMLKVRSPAERVITNGTSSTVRLELLSETYLDSLTMSISRGFKNQYSKAATTYWQAADFSKPFKTDDSDGIYTFALPHTKTVFENIDWMASRARTSDGMPFVFFEDIDEFSFCSWSKILKQAPKLKLFHQSQILLDKPEKVFRNILAVESGTMARDASVFALNDLTARREYIFNPLSKETTVRDRTFKEFVDAAPRLDAGGFTTALPTNSSVRVLVTKSDNSQSNSYFRDALNYVIQSNTMTVMTYGDDQMRLGTVVELNLLAPQIQDGKNPVEEKFVNGNFLVIGLKHTIRPNEYRLYWKLSKESYKTEVMKNGG